MSARRNSERLAEHAWCMGGRRRETLEEREHRFDREAAAATYRRRRAAADKGYKFRVPRKAVA